MKNEELRIVCFVGEAGSEIKNGVMRIEKNRHHGAAMRNFDAVALGSEKWICDIQKKALSLRVKSADG